MDISSKDLIVIGIRSEATRLTEEIEKLQEELRKLQEYCSHVGAEYKKVETGGIHFKKKYVCPHCRKEWTKE